MSAADPKRQRPNFEVIPVYRPDPERCARAAVELVQERAARLAAEARVSSTEAIITTPTPPVAEQAKEHEAAS